MPKNVGNEIWIGTIPYRAIYFQDSKSGKKKLYLIKDIKVPRFYGFNEVKGDTIELHILTDSSQVLYGTCAYFCIIQGNDIKISFIIGKSCLVPLNSKVLTIPKLELQTAVIASRMKGKIVDDLELVGDLSTDSFILALKRLIARRGQPKVMYSDNGSNFRGAEKELGDLFSKIDFDKVSKTLTNDNINRKFIPPLSSWMGGAWESVAKLTKKALRIVTYDRPMYEDSLSTFIAEIESVLNLNSRPLTSVTDDPNDYNVLTPNHFILGRESLPFTLNTE